MDSIVCEDVYVQACTTDFKLPQRAYQSPPVEPPVITVSPSYSHPSPSPPPVIQQQQPPDLVVRAPCRLEFNHVKVAMGY